eukprot:c23186_g1_i1.p1 GENE.c23186_g1_i1~~c23186_g1_i1.p1  ORF type:complete len:328 (-),score=99.57 c23186_g1_i1:182-1120(-)
MDTAGEGEDVQFGRRIRRAAVSDKSYNPEDSKNKPRKTVPKSKDQRTQIDNKLQTNFLFAHLTEESRSEIVDVVVEKVFKQDDVIIKQGDEGDYFYIVEEGTCEIFVNDTKVMTCTVGDSFGELALMYNAPRAATVKAVSKEVKCWVLDKDTFKYTLMNHTIRKRDMYEAFLREVPLLSTLLDYERLTIADALAPEKFLKGHFIVTQGETGDKFFIVEKGVVKIVKDGLEMGSIEAGGYFGELALLTNNPRAASIVAVSDTVIVLGLDRKTFTGVMGPLHILLKRKAGAYEQYFNEEFAAMAMDDDKDDDDD